MLETKGHFYQPFGSENTILKARLTAFEWGLFFSQGQSMTDCNDDEASKVTPRQRVRTHGLASQEHQNLRCITMWSMASGAMGAFLYKNHKAPKSSDGLFAAVGLLAFNFFLANDHATTIDNVGHFGGLVCGIYLGVLLAPAVIDSPPSDPPTPGDTAAKGVEEAGYAAAEITTPANAVPSKDSVGGSNSPETSEDRAQNVKVVQPNRLQSIIVLACVTMTLASSVAATVIHRTGELPFPKWL